jgi:hypothetical protein
MCKKLKPLFVFVAMLGLVSSVQADLRWYFGQGQVRDWTDVAGWNGGVVPTDSDPAGSYAIMVHDGTVNVTTAGQGCLDMWLGYESGAFMVNIAAGTYFHITEQLLIGYGGLCSSCGATGVLNIGEGASVRCEQLQVGVSPTYHGIVNVSNGGLLTCGTWGTMIGPGDTGSVNLRGTGSMTALTGITIGIGSHINIEKGQLKVSGDWRTQLQGYVNDGRITSFERTLRRCTPKVTYESGWTYVKTSGGCTCASYPVGDLNHDCYVDLSDLATLAEDWLDCTNSADVGCSQVQLDMRETTLRIKHDGQSIDISLSCPKFTFNVDSTLESIAPVSIVGNISSGQVVTVSFNPIALNGSVSIEPQLLLQWSPNEKIVRKWARYRITGTPSNLVLQEIVLEKMARSLLLTEPLSNAPQSYPAFANGFFMGIEFPVASTRLEGLNLILGHKPGSRPQVNVWYESRKAVYGAATPGKEKEAFQAYITLHRPAPTSSFICYNTWYSLTPTTRESTVMNLMQSFNDNMTKPYGVSFDCFTIDGTVDSNGPTYWSKSKSIWQVDLSKFPSGLTPLHDYAQGMGTLLGLWTSPTSQYVGATDTDWAYQNGYETWKWAGSTQGIICLAGPRYHQAYTNALIDLVNTYGVRQFKFDGLTMQCPEAWHGHEPNELSSEAIGQAAVDTFQAIHSACPSVWLRTTCFSWSGAGSPWWLLYVNSETGTFGDDAPIGKVPCPIYRECNTTARDYYNLQGAAWSPTPINGQEVMGINHATPEPLLNDAVIVVMRGHAFVPLYLNPAQMNSERWFDLAHVLAWARTNSETLLANTYPLLPASWQNGKAPKFSSYSIMPREIYGYAHCKNNQALISLRNPWIQPQTYTLTLNDSIGFTSQAAGLSAVSLYPENRIYGQNLHYGSTLTFLIAPYETVVLSIGSGYNLSGIPTVGGSIGGKIQTTVTQSSATTDLTVSLQATVDTTAPQTKLLVCMEGTYQNTTALATPTYQLLVNGVPASVTVISSEDGWRATGIQAWEHWKFLQVTLTSAHNVISLQQLHPDPNCTNVSIWAWATKNGGGMPSFQNSLPSPEFINLDAVLLGNFNR